MEVRVPRVQPLLILPSGPGQYVKENDPAVHRVADYGGKQGSVVQLTANRWKRRRSAAGSIQAIEDGCVVSQKIWRSWLSPTSRSPFPR